MPFGRIGKFVAVVLAVAMFNAAIPQCALADAPAPAQKEQPAKGSLPSDQELAEMRLAEMEAPSLHDFKGGAVIPLLVISVLGLVAIVTFVLLVVLPEKESPSVPDGYPHNTKAPEVTPAKTVVAAGELDELQKQAEASKGLSNFSAGR